MTTPLQTQQRIQDRDVKALEKLRKLRRARAEQELVMAREEESVCRDDALAAASARQRASTRLHDWNANLCASDDRDRVEKGMGLSQAIFEFNQLSTQLRRLEFAEFAADRRESIAAEKVLAKAVVARAGAVSHEKIVECRK